MQAEKFSRLKGRITCAVSGRGCGPCTRSEKTQKSAQRIFSRLRGGPLARLASVKAALRCRSRPLRTG